MDKNEEFDLDFDFEKEYGFSPDTIMDPEYDNDDSFDIDLGPEEDYGNLDDFGTPEDYTVPEDYTEPEDFTVPEDYPQDDFDLNQDYTPSEDFSPMEGYDVRQDYVPEPRHYQNSLNQEAVYDERATYDEFDGDPVPPVQVPVPAPKPKRRRQKPQRRPNPFANRTPPAGDGERTSPVGDAAPVPPPTPEEPNGNARRRKRSQMRIIKEDYLPIGIAGVALLLCLIFIIGSIVRGVDRANTKRDNEIKASEQAASEAERLEQEAEDLCKQAAAIAAGYDYEGAIKLLDTFSGDMTKFEDMLSDRGKYAQMMDTLVEITDFSAVPNLSFHVLIADPGRAFSEQSGNRAAYNQNFVTIDEFSAILQQLYDKGYVLINFDSFIQKTTDEAGNVSFSTKSIYLPEGKKPIMITETLVNYFQYMIDGNDDGVPDAQGEGFASRLVLDGNGKITCEMVDASGETITGAYDLVPILNEFIEAHPDFSYRGAKATLAVTGSEGVFGYRINTGNADEIAGAQQIVQALKDDGYLIACNSYTNLSYGNAIATEIQADLNKWTEKIVPVIGQVDILVYARGADITDYTGPKYNVMHNAGFRYFIGSATTPATQINHAYIHQSRIMVTGSLMVNSAQTLAPYFDATAVLNGERP